MTVEYNGHEIDAPVTRTVVMRLLEDCSVDARVRVTHRSDLPIGVGFGASGAGALGTALALGPLLDPDMGPERLAQYAHCSEVANRTGLGDVIAQTCGGFEVRTRPGAPGVGELQQIAPPENLCVVLAGARGVETREVLSDPSKRGLVNSTGDRTVARLLDSPSFEEFIACSRAFARETGLMTRRIASALDALDAAGHHMASMVMLGDSLFCFCDTANSGDVVRILSRYWPASSIVSTSVALQGGRLVAA